MTDSGPVRNMKSILSNKFEKLWFSLAFIIRIRDRTVVARLLAGFFLGGLREESSWHEKKH